ncbi:hypothetical protein QJS83_08665 [Bdellovibrio sp. 22V]|uniref:RCC1 domain-containing protein n=1 Tax=Bdellovibrio sp. 22V TaxID=3044166 RepID=UPI002542CDAE|nr:hypothetical protein [Bdellovibrio sp. 22V]WII70528.1 hypothetical protein QJS83_08665 [Bdellovibrio sp. 22V]
MQLARLLGISLIVFGSFAAHARPQHQGFNQMLGKCSAADVSIAPSSAQLLTEGQGVVNLTVSLSKKACIDLPIFYNYFSTGTEGTHFSTGGTKSITIPKGQTSAQISIDILQNGLTEDEKNLYVYLKGTNQKKQKIKLGFEPYRAFMIVDDESTYVNLNSVATSAGHICLLNSDSKIRCWGVNAYGQVGNGTFTTVKVPTAVDSATTYKEIKMSANSTCGITQAGVLKCWGHNSYGQIGDGTTINRSSPTVINSGTNYDVVGMGYTHTCAVTTGGVAKCWGANNKGQLGDGTLTASSSPVLVSGGALYSDISAGGSNDGGGGHTCAITQAGQLQCWGRNDFGQLGIGSLTNQSSPQNVDAGVTYSSVVIGYNTSCAITTSGALKCWGGNAKGQVGDGTVMTRTAPVLIDSGVSYAKVSVAQDHVCALTTGNKVKCWGDNTSFQLGRETQIKVPTEIDASENYKSLSVGGGSYNASVPVSCGVTVGNYLKCWGVNPNGIFNNSVVGVETVSVRDVDIGAIYSKISMGGRSGCGISADQDLLCWGANNNFQIGDRTDWNRYTPVFADAGNKYSFVSVAAGTVTSSQTPHTCAITTTGVLKCWGDNSYGKIGDGTTVDKTMPKVIDPGVTYTKVAVAAWNTCAVTTAGVLKCWGRNNNGQLGIGTTVDSLTPKVVDAGVTYSEVAISEDYDNGKVHACAITTAGILKCWGSNAHAALGDGTTTNSTLPKVIDSVTYTKIAVGAAFLGGYSCGITTSNELKCWGYNGQKNLGDGTTTQRTSPIVIDAGTQFKEVSLKGSHSCAITLAGVLKCWGYNFYSMVGDGTTVSPNAPIVIDSGTSYSSISVGHAAWTRSASCGITTAGGLRCWGIDYFGEMGLPVGTHLPSYVPGARK